VEEELLIELPRLKLCVRVHVCLGLLLLIVCSVVLARCVLLRWFSNSNVGQKMMIKDYAGKREIVPFVGDETSS
jgi:hypothetical protein